MMFALGFISGFAVCAVVSFAALLVVGAWADMEERRHAWHKDMRS